MVVVMVVGAAGALSVMTSSGGLVADRLRCVAGLADCLQRQRVRRVRRIDGECPGAELEVERTDAGDRLQRAPDVRFFRAAIHRRDAKAPACRQRCGLLRGGRQRDGRSATAVGLLR